MPTLKECLGKSIIPLPYQNELLGKVQSLALEHGVEKASRMAVEDLYGSTSGELGKMLGQFGLAAKIPRSASVQDREASVSTSGVGQMGANIPLSAEQRSENARQFSQAAPIAGAVVGGLLAGPVGFAAGGVIGGEIANVAQDYTPTVGERVTQVAGMAPTGVVGGIVKQGVANAVQQIASKQVGQNVDQAVAGQSPTLLPASELYSLDVIASGLAPAAASGVNRAASAVDLGVDAFKKGASVREVGKLIATAPFVQPGEITQQQQARNEARAAIKTLTSEDVPVTVAEAIGRFDLAKMKNEITPESQARLQKVAMWAAAAHPELKNMDVETRATFVQELLKNEGHAVSQQVARDVANSAAAVSAQLAGDVKQAVPGTTSESVNRLRGAFNKGWETTKKAYDSAYDAVRSLKGYKEVTGYPDEAKKVIASIINERPGIAIEGRTKQIFKEIANYGENLPNASKLSPDEYLAAAQKDSSTPLTIDKARQIRTEIFEAIENDGIFPSISKADKQRIVAALSDDIKAITEKADPAVKPALRAANAKFSDAMERYNHKFFENTSKSVGEQGGTTSGTIVSNLSGDSGDDYLGMVRGMAKDNPEILPAARDSVVAKLIKGQGSNPQGMLDSINKMADGVKAEFFPNLKQIEALANRAASISGITGLKGDALLSKIKDTDAFAAALTDRSKGSASASVTKLLDDTATSIRGFKNEVIQDAALAGKRPLDFIDGVTSGNLYKQSEITEVMAKLPDDAKSAVRESMMNRIIGKANGDPDSMLTILNDRAQGPRIKTILGNDEHAFLVKTAEDLKTLTPGAPDAKKPGSLIAALTRAGAVGAVAYQMTKSPYWTAGAAGVALAKDSLYNSIPRLQQIGGDAKFDMAAKLLSTPAMREMAVTPVDKLNPDQTRLLGAFLAEEIRRQEKSASAK